MKPTNMYKQKMFTEKTLTILFLSAVFGLAGCQPEGTAEKTGKKIDRATESTGQKIEQAADKTGKAIEGAKQSVTEKAETTGEYIDDSAITAKVKAAILNDPLLNTSQIEVTTVNGVVKLSGTVDSKKSIDRAIEVVSSQKNVKSIENDMVVKPSVPGKE